FRLGACADLQRINSDRFGDVFERCRAEIIDLHIQPRLDLAIRILGKTDRSRLSHSLQPRGDVDAVAPQITVSLFDHVADMNANAELDAPVLGHAGVPLHHRVLHFDGAPDRVDRTAELHNCAVAGALHYAPVVYCNGWIDQIASEGPQPRQYPILVG